MSSTGNPPVQPPSGLTGSQLLQVLRDNFVLISAGAVVIGVGLATIFLAAYLSIFDWHLLWFVQYTDVLTSGLLAAGVISGSLLFLQAAIQTVLNLFKLEAASRRRWIIALCLIVMAIVTFNVWAASRVGEGYFHILYGVLVIAFGLIVCLQIVGYATIRTLPNVVQFTNLFIFLVLGTVYCGQWLGYSVLESGKLLDIKVKDSTMSGMKLIIVLSRYTILLKGGDTFVVPTADIGEFRPTGRQ
jgi:hypothetical protein